MKISKKTDISIRILLYLRNENKIVPNYISANQIAAHLDISYNHIRKIISDLNELGLIDSKLGKSGGIALCHEYNIIPIKELLLKMEDYVASSTRIDCSTCNYNSECHFDSLVNRGLLSFFDTFANTYLDDL